MCDLVVSPEGRVQRVHAQGHRQGHHDEARRAGRVFCGRIRVLGRVSVVVVCSLVLFLLLFTGGWG